LLPEPFFLFGGDFLTFLNWRKLAVVGFALCASFARAGSIPDTVTSSGTLNLSSGTDYFGWSGQTVSISSTISSMTPTSVTNLANGGVQDVYNAIINITGFQANQAGTMILTWYPTASGSDAVSVAMTYSNFGLTTTVTETLNNVNMPSASPADLLNAVLTSPFDEVTVTSNWGENATFGVNGALSSSDATHVAEAAEPATFAFLCGGFILLAFFTLRRRSVPVRVSE
jgi:hypothetical protein